MNNLSLALKVTHFTFDHTIISSLLDLTPSIIHKQGEEYYIGPRKNSSKKQYEYNYWEYRIHIENNSQWITTIVNQFVDEIILTKTDELKRIKDDCKLELYIGVTFEGGSNISLDSYHFDVKFLTLLADLNIEIDIDQYLFESKLK